MIEKNQLFGNKLITDYSHDGMGICKEDGFLIFVLYAKINQNYDIKITKVERNLAYAIVVNQDINAECKHYKQCGGCDIMHLNYEEQIEFKKIKLKNIIKKFNLKTELNGFIKAEEQFRYRNKVQMPFMYIDKEVKLGFYKKRTHHILEINQCLIQSEKINNLFKFIENLMTETEQKVYNEDKFIGLLRHLYLRETKYGQIMVCFVLNGDKLLKQDYIVKQIISNFKEVTSIVINVNKRKTNAVLGYKNLNIYNKNYVEEMLNDYRFRLLPNAFFQVNTNQTIKLYDTAIKLANLTATDNVLDAFCGVGTIGIYASKYVKSVIGIEIVEQAIKSANKNKEMNSIENISFLCSDANREISKITNRFDIVFVDPPRKGLGQEFIDALINTKPKKVVYISCDPATLARDLTQLSKIYTIENFVGIDMFANTHHVETVVSLLLEG